MSWLQVSDEGIEEMFTAYQNRYSIPPGPTFLAPDFRPERNEPVFELHEKMQSFKKRLDSRFGEAIQAAGDLLQRIGFKSVRAAQAGFQIFTELEKTSMISAQLKEVQEAVEAEELKAPSQEFVKDFKKTAGSLQKVMQEMEARFRTFYKENYDAHKLQKPDLPSQALIYSGLADSGEGEGNSASDAYYLPDSQAWGGLYPSYLEGRNETMKGKSWGSKGKGKSKGYGDKGTLGRHGKAQQLDVDRAKEAWPSTLKGKGKMTPSFGKAGKGRNEWGSEDQRRQGAGGWEPEMPDKGWRGDPEKYRGKREALEADEQTWGWGSGKAGQGWGGGTEGYTEKGKRGRREREWGKGWSDKLDNDGQRWGGDIGGYRDEEWTEGKGTKGEWGKDQPVGQENWGWSSGNTEQDWAKDGEGYNLDVDSPTVPVDQAGLSPVPEREVGPASSSAPNPTDKPDEYDEYTLQSPHKQERKKKHTDEMKQWDDPASSMESQGQGKGDAGYQDKHDLPAAALLEDPKSPALPEARRDSHGSSKEGGEVAFGWEDGEKEEDPQQQDTGLKVAERTSFEEGDLVAFGDNRDPSEVVKLNKDEKIIEVAPDLVEDEAVVQDEQVIQGGVPQDEEVVQNTAQDEWTPLPQVHGLGGREQDEWNVPPDPASTRWGGKGTPYAPPPRLPPSPYAYPYAGKGKGKSKGKGKGEGVPRGKGGHGTKGKGKGKGYWG